MNTKTIITIFSILFLAGITLLAVGTTEKNTNSSNQPAIEKMAEMNNMPQHCDHSSSCSSEDAAQCPYSHHMEKSSTSEKAPANCPMTPDCPPSKCTGDKQSEKSTL